jgi:MYXO-CTERM domain-containing protein
MKGLTSIAIPIALAYSAGTMALQNSNFAEYDSPADGTTAGYDVQQGPPSWFLTAALDGGTVTYSAADAAETGGYFQFNQLNDGYGASKLEQCVPVNDTDTLEISYSVYAASTTDDAAGMGVRINPNFYADLADCLEAQATNSGGNRLSAGGTRPNADIDFVLGAEDGRRWLTRTPEAAPGLRYTAADIPDGARFLNLSIRARDRQFASPATLLRFDDIRVVQGSAGNRVVNGQFTHAELGDGSPLAGSDGWIVNRGGDATLKAAVGPAFFALSGANVFYFETLTGNFGVNSLDQCFALDGADIRPSLFATSFAPDAALQVRVNVDFFTDAGCTTAAPGELRIRQDFAVDGDAGAWVALVTDVSRGPGEYGAATHALLTIRGRDRSNDIGDGPGAFARALFIDDVDVAGGTATPTFSPAPGSYANSVTVTLSSATDGAVIYYTLDGSNPTDSSSNVPSGGTVSITTSGTLTARAFANAAFSGPRSGVYTITAPPPPPPPPPRELGTGCSVSGEPSPLDPTLWVLAGIAGIGLAWRRRRRSPTG